MTTVEIARKILEALENNPILSEYVKSFSIGGIGVSRKLFPYIAVEAPRRESSLLTMGRNGYMNNVYTFRIIGGTYHTLPEIANAGNDKGKKGIVQLNSDILNAVIPNNFDDTFAGPARLISSITYHDVPDGGRSWTTVIIMRGRNRSLKQEISEEAL